MTWTAEEQLRYAGRLQCIEDALKSALSDLPVGELHAGDLLVIARDATHKALIHIWGKAPEIPASTDQEPHS